MKVNHPGWTAFSLVEFVYFHFGTTVLCIYTFRSAIMTLQPLFVSHPTECNLIFIPRMEVRKVFRVQPHFRTPWESSYLQPHLHGGVLAHRVALRKHSQWPTVSLTVQSQPNCSDQSLIKGNGERSYKLRCAYKEKSQYPPHVGHDHHVTCESHEHRVRAFRVICVTSGKDVRK